MRGPFGAVRGKLAHRLSVMIDWRVRKAFEDERVVILDTNKTVIEISTLLSDRIVALEASILQLRRELDALEKRQQ